MRGLYITFTPQYVRPVVITYEPETEAFLTALGVSNDSTTYMGSTAYEITGANLWTYTDAFVVDIKTALGLTLGVNNLSTRVAFWYPAILDTSSAHSYNLVDPTQYQITWVGGVSHDGAGWYGNGTNGYGDTGCSMLSAGYTRTSISMHYLSKTDINGSYIDMGVTRNTSPQWDMIMGARFSGNFLSRFGVAGVNDTTAVADSLGFYSVSRNSTTQYDQYKDGTSIATKSNSAPNDQNSSSIYLGAWDSGGTPSLYSPRKMAHHIFGTYFSPTEIQDIKNAVSNYETLLNR